MAVLFQVKNSAFPALVFGVGVAVLASCGPASSSAERGPLSAQPAIAPISVPPGINDRPLAAGQSGTEYMPNGMPALAPMRGVNADTMFSEKLSNEDARFKRLENAVADMRREFEAVKPAIVRLTAVEADMEELVAQLQTLVPQSASTPRISIDDVAPPSAPSSAAAPHIDDAAPIPDIGPMTAAQTAELDAPRPVKNSKPAAAAQPAIAAISTAPKADAPPVKITPAAKDTKPAPVAARPGVPTVTALRVGEHDGTTRIVLDLSAAADFTSNLDNGEHLLLIELPKAAWSGPRSGGSAKSSLLASWSVSDSGSGHILAITLKKNASVSAQKLPASGAAASRLVFDLKASP